MEEKIKKKDYNKDIDNCDDELEGLDMSFQGIKVIGKEITLLVSLKQLILNNNDIETIPEDISNLIRLEVLDFSYNKIEKIPTELGRLINLKELYLNNNMIVEVPMELGTLYKLENFSILNNPLVHPYGIMSKDKSLLRFCRENNTNYKQPNDRVWIDTVLKIDQSLETYSFGTFNILCSLYASNLTYAPSWVINLECRKDILMQTFIAYNLDILCLQEVDINVFNTFYKEQLAQKLNYDGVILPKKSFDKVTDQPKKFHGIVTFWKKNKFKLIEQVSIDFFQKIINDKRFKYLSDIHTRIFQKTNVGLITIFETCNTNIIIIVANVHLYWNPEFNDIKILQTIIYLEEIEFLKEKYKHAHIVLQGDFNSLQNSHVYQYIINRKLPTNIFDPWDYGSLNNGVTHSLTLRNAYDGHDITFTNFTPSFKAVIDYIFYSKYLNLISIISPIEDEYTKTTIGLPNIHFPSDHILIGAKFQFKSSKK